MQSLGYINIDEHELGRGLDIFEKYSPYSIANSRQDMRKCKDFMITYMKDRKSVV